MSHPSSSITQLVRHRAPALRPRLRSTLAGLRGRGLTALGSTISLTALRVASGRVARGGGIRTRFPEHSSELGLPILQTPRREPARGRNQGPRGRNRAPRAESGRQPGLAGLRHWRRPHHAALPPPPTAPARGPNGRGARHLSASGVGAGPGAAGPPPGGPSPSPLPPRPSHASAQWRPPG